MAKNDAKAATDDRYKDLKEMLTLRRRELAEELQDKLSGVREGGVRLREALDRVETSSESANEDIELALIQLKTETLNRIDGALQRHEQREYGYCRECGDEIGEKRLRAMPFADRCKDCEEAFEATQPPEHQSRKPLFGK